MNKTPFNKPYFAGNEIEFMQHAVALGHISGNGAYTAKCQGFFQQRYGFKKCLLTTSCTDALEMCALLLDISPGDEVIMPSYTFVSTANAFVLRGARVIFADSCKDNPNMDVSFLASLITPDTKAIVVVHYAGVAVDMDEIMALAAKHNLYVVEDAAQAIESFYTSRITGMKKPLGSIGHLAAFSFHETKNIMCGEGGLLVINDEQFIRRAEILWEKGTNRSEFFKGAVNKYGWVDVGSSFLPSDLLAACLYAQLQAIENIQSRRLAIWHNYYNGLVHLQEREVIQLPVVPDFATNNAHMFYLVCSSVEERDGLIGKLRQHEILAVFHYQSLHKSAFYENRHDGRILEQSDRYTDCLLRLPMYYELADSTVSLIVNLVNRYFEEN